MSHWSKESSWSTFLLAALDISKENHLQRLTASEQQSTHKHLRLREDLELLKLKMPKINLSIVALGVTLLLIAETWAQNPKKRLTPLKPAKGQCCDEVRSLKVQVANLTSILEELTRKQETDLMMVVRQIMDLDQQNRKQEARVTEAESKYSEINNRVEIMQLQTLQSAPQTSSGEPQHF